MMISEDAINSNNMAAKLLSSASEYETRGLKAEKLERLRDEFAMAALSALINHPNKDGDKMGAKGVPILAKFSYEYADAMLAAREIKNG